MLAMKKMRTAIAALGVTAAALAGSTSVSADDCSPQWQAVVGCDDEWECWFWEFGLNAISSGNYYYTMDIGGGAYQVGYFAFACVVTVT